MGFLSWLGKSALKVGAVGAAVKISIDNHVWDLQTKDGEKEFEMIRKNVLPGTIVFKEEIPSKDRSQVITKWNQYVNCAFSYINNAPDKINQRLNSFYKSDIAVK